MFMQMDIVMHEISHIHSPANLCQSFTSQEHSPQPNQDTTHEHCGQCLAYAQVDVALPSVAIHVVAETSTYFISTAYIAYLLLVVPSAYQARAPPFLA